MIPHAKHRFLHLLVLSVFVCVACGSASLHLGHVDYISDISSIKPVPIQSADEAEKVIKQYSIDFDIPNPLYGSDISFRRMNPNHEDTIKNHVTLLDDTSTEADILYHCFRDSLDAAACDKYREAYTREKVRKGMFRIRISMESGFSPKSMEPEHWTIYLENAKGVIIEPADITASAVTSLEDSVYSDFYRINFSRHLMKRDLTLYFNRKTFFGEDLLSRENPFIVLVITREKKTLARLAWKSSALPKKK